MKEWIPEIPFFKKSNPGIEFDIFTIGSLLARQSRLDHEICKPHRIEFYIIIYITGGSGVHSIDFKTYKYKEGSLLFVSNRQVHAFDAKSGTDGFLILFTEDFISKNMVHADILSFYRLYNYHLHEPVMHPDLAMRDAFKNIFQEMYKEYLLADDFAKEEILRLLLKLLLLRAERMRRTLIHQEKNTEWFNTFSTFRSHLEKHFAETRNANDYADKLNISYKHLNTVCKSLTGLTAKKFIDRYIILEAKRCLAVADIPVKELTYDLGFDEPTNFLKYFKKHAGLSPAQFKADLTK